MTKILVVRRVYVITPDIEPNGPRLQHARIAELAYVFVYCFVVYPMTFKLCGLACAKLRTRCCNLCGDVLLSSAVVGFGAVFYVICWLVTCLASEYPLSFLGVI